jgi:hypothetical protein
LFIGSVVEEELYLFPPRMKFILLLSFFFTVYLTVFLLFSLKQEPVTIIQSRLKQLQVSLLEQFYGLKGEEDWGRWVREMEYRREEISALLKQGVRPASGSLNEEIDILINKSWDEFLSMLGSRRESGFDVEKLRTALNGVLAALPKAGTENFVTGTETLTGGPLPLIGGRGAPAPNGRKTGLLGKASAIVREIEEAALVEELDVIEELDLTDLPDAPFAPPKDDIDALASEIEFSPVPEPDTTEDEFIGRDLEIVSPFSVMLGGLDKPLNGGLLWKAANKNGVIKERGGLPFVSAEARYPAPEEKDGGFINRDFKNLVDSVIKE